MPRRKSSRQISEQEYRLLNNPRITDSRAQRVSYASMSYRNRIASMRSFANTINAGEGFAAARDRQYSRSTYMGNNNG